jgi:uncharacterized protein (DUF1778 family)
MLRTLQKAINDETTQVDAQVKAAGRATPKAEAEAQRVGRDQEKVKKLMESLSNPEAAGPGGPQI